MGNCINYIEMPFDKCFTSAAAAFYFYRSPWKKEKVFSIQIYLMRVVVDRTFRLGNPPDRRVLTMYYKQYREVWVWPDVKHCCAKGWNSKAIRKGTKESWLWHKTFKKELEGKYVVLKTTVKKFEKVSYFLTPLLTSDTENRLFLEEIFRCILWDHLYGVFQQRGFWKFFSWVLCAWWNSAKLPRQITTLTTLFLGRPGLYSSAPRHTKVFPNCIFPILLVSQQFSLSKFSQRSLPQFSHYCALHELLHWAAWLLTKIF